MTTTQEYETWWRDSGQFLQPADAMSNDPNGLALLKSWGQSLWEMKLPAEEEAIENAQESADAANAFEEKLSDLKAVIVRTIGLRDGTPTETLKKVLELVENEN